MVLASRFCDPRPKTENRQPLPSSHSSTRTEIINSLRPVLVSRKLNSQRTTEHNGERGTLSFLTIPRNM